MSRQKMKTRDKTTLQSTRDGLLERNNSTGEDNLRSNREADYDLRSKAPEREPVSKVVNESYQPDAKTKRSIFGPVQYRAEKDQHVQSRDLHAGLHIKTIQEKETQTIDALLGTSKPEKPQFMPDKTMPGTQKKIHRSRKPGIAQSQADHTVKKLNTAKRKLTQKRILSTGRVLGQKPGAAKHKLHFVGNNKSQAKHPKDQSPLRPAKATGNPALVLGHHKLYQAERENVATEAAHKGAILTEGSIRSALRLRKAATYNKGHRPEREAAKKYSCLTHQHVCDKKPKQKSNIITRALQKRKIKKDYAKAAREAQKTAKRAKKAGSAVTDAGRAVFIAARHHPAITLVIILITLLLLALSSLIGAFGSLGNGSLSGILASTYLADDTEIDNAELAYTKHEIDMLIKVASTESTQPGYDEYRYRIDEVNHNPIELMAYLTVKYQNFTYDAVSADLEAIFGEQYVLTFTHVKEKRYRTVTKTNPVTGESYNQQVSYDWNVMIVALTARSLSDIIVSRMSDDEYAHYALLLETRGARQYIKSPFGFDWLPCVNSCYGYRIHPISGLVDLHRGVDIGAAQGTKIYSGHGGTVTFAGYSGDYGNVVVITGDRGLVSKYAHCATLHVASGQTVKTGELIATVGSTGNSTGPHLHLEVMKNGIYLNPLFFADTGSVSDALN